MDLLNLARIGEMIVAVSAFMQYVKRRKTLRKRDGETLSLTLGVVLCLGWALVLGEIFLATGVNWIEVFRAVVNGGIAGISASGLFNIQKFLPIPNLLPTRSELDAQATTPAERKDESDDR